MSSTPRLLKVARIDLCNQLSGLAPSASRSSHLTTSRLPLAASTAGRLPARPVMRLDTPASIRQSLASAVLVVSRLTRLAPSPARSVERSNSLLTSRSADGEPIQAIRSTAANAGRVPAQRRWSGIEQTATGRRRSVVGTASRSCTASASLNMTPWSASSTESVPSAATAGITSTCTSITTTTLATFVACSVIDATEPSVSSKMTLRSFARPLPTSCAPSALI